MPCMKDFEFTIRERRGLVTFPFTKQWRDKWSILRRLNELYDNFYSRRTQKVWHFTPVWHIQFVSSNGAKLDLAALIKSFFSLRRSSNQTMQNLYDNLFPIRYDYPSNSSIAFHASLRIVDLLPSPTFVTLHIFQKISDSLSLKNELFKSHHHHSAAALHSIANLEKWYSSINEVEL